MRNLNPLVAVFGLPAWDIVPIGTRFGVTGEVANHYRFSLQGNERLMLDGETLRTTLSLTHGFASGWSLGVDMVLVCSFFCCSGVVFRTGAWSRVYARGPHPSLSLSTSSAFLSFP